MRSLLGDRIAHAYVYVVAGGAAAPPSGERASDGRAGKDLESKARTITIHNFGSANKPLDVARE